MSNTTIRRLSKDEAVLLKSLFEKADVAQQRAFLENMEALPVTVFSSIVEASNDRFQLFRESFPTSKPYDKTPFVVALRTYIAWSLAKNKEKTAAKGGLMAVESSAEMNQLLLRLRQKEAVLQVTKSAEEVIRLRIANKKDSETSLSLDVLMPLLSECFGQAANSLRALALFYPDSVNVVNDCIDGFIRLGRRLAYEAKTEVEHYLTEFKTTEESLQEVLSEISELTLAIQKQQEEELSMENFEEPQE